MDIYAMITDRVIESLNKGTVPWQQPWSGGQFGQPRNFVSTKPYRGINVFLLSATGQAMGYTSPFWVTYKQAQSLGGTVKKGEKSHSPVVFYSIIQRKEVKDDEDESYRMLRYTPVFNVEQCEGLNVPDLNSGIVRHEHEIIASAQTIVDNMPNRPTLHIQTSGRAFYNPSHDSVTVPELSQYAQPEQYYSTLFHELGHSTGHKSRLDRDFKAVHFGDHEYSKEELVAEFTASYLCGFAGIEDRTIEQNAAYLHGWLTVLKDTANRKWLTWAASQAQKAADFIQGVQIEAKREAA